MPFTAGKSILLGERKSAYHKLIVVDMGISMKLNETSLTPLYQQLMEDIKFSIENGKYRYDDKIPTEPELSSSYGVSRITVRRAVDELCNEGYLIKKQGKGTFVCKPKLLRKIERSNEVLSFSKACILNGMKPGAKVLDYQISFARLDEQDFFGVDETTKILYIQRVLTADDTPIMLENNFYVYDKFKFLQDEALENTSLFEVLEKHGVFPSKTVKSTLEIVKAEVHHAKDLDVVVGEPLFYMTVYFGDDLGNPIFIGRQYMVGSRYKFNDI